MVRRGGPGRGRRPGPARRLSSVRSRTRVAERRGRRLLLGPGHPPGPAARGPRVRPDGLDGEPRKRRRLHFEQKGALVRAAAHRRAPLVRPELHGQDAACRPRTSTSSSRRTSRRATRSSPRGARLIDWSATLARWPRPSPPVLLRRGAAFYEAATRPGRGPRARAVGARGRPRARRRRRRRPGARGGHRRVHGGRPREEGQDVRRRRPRRDPRRAAGAVRLVGFFVPFPGVSWYNLVSSLNSLRVSRGSLESWKAGSSCSRGRTNAVLSHGTVLGLVWARFKLAT